MRNFLADVFLHEADDDAAACIGKRLAAWLKIDMPDRRLLHRRAELFGEHVDGDDRGRLSRRSKTCAISAAV